MTQTLQEMQIEDEKNKPRVYSMTVYYLAKKEEGTVGLTDGPFISAKSASYAAEDKYGWEASYYFVVETQQEFKRVEGL